ncbi:hypothetical protein FJT64_015808 [Amphibalanus amphitrite]|uniref:Uncharacterized protein n=2 Tax=Amphibalanus amphitrite TaxID=1232801 RepID=A0A6A4XG45_AMPAM|nr:hypothetical protein FJT64_015808 [Amphibalanus amphitrite]
MVLRLDALERRLAAMENNNRSMMAQFTQLQQEATVGVRRDAHAVSEQRESRGRMEMALRGAQQKLADVDHRIGRASNVMRETQSSIQAMAVQTNTMQNALAASGRDTEEMALARLQEARQEILDLLQYHDTSRKAATALREDMQNMRMKVETLSGDLQAMAHSSRLQEEMFEEETRRTLRGGGGSGGSRIPATAALEGKVARLQNSLKDVESRILHETKKDGIAQQVQNQKIGELQEEVSGCARLVQQDVRDLQLHDSGADPDVPRLQREVDSIRSRLDSRLADSRSASSRADAEEKELKAQLKDLEQKLQKEVSDRTQREADLKNEVERKLTEISQYSDDGFRGVTKLTEGEHEQTKQRFRELLERLDQVESKRDKDQEEIDKLFEKQRDERRKLDRVMDERLDDVGDRLRIAMASLMAAQSELPPGEKAPPGGLSMEEIERLQNMNTTGAREQLMKDLAAKELQLSELSTRIEQQDEVIENKLKMAEKSDSNELGVMGDELTRKADTITFSQERLKKQIENLDERVKESPQEINQLQDRVVAMETETLEKLEKQDVQRRQEVEDLTADVRKKVDEEEKKAAEMARLEKAVDQSHTSVTKLSEAMQTINRVIGGKIKEGKRTREQETTDLKRNIDRLYEQNTDLKNRIKHPGAYR